MKRTTYIILLIIFALFLGNCATQKARDYNNLRGLMLLQNTELRRNKIYNSPKYRRTLKHNSKKIFKKT
jgi:hypothetical protein